jgi:hypothetical protein
MNNHRLGAGADEKLNNTDVWNLTAIADALDIPLPSAYWHVKGGLVRRCRTNVAGRRGYAISHVGLIEMIIADELRTVSMPFATIIQTLDAFRALYDADPGQDLSDLVLITLGQNDAYWRRETTLMNNRPRREKGMVYMELPIGYAYTEALQKLRNQFAETGNDPKNVTSLPSADDLNGVN